MHCYKHTRSVITVIAILATSIISCKKEGTNNDTSNPSDTVATDAGMFYKLHRVENFQGDTTDNAPTSVKATLYYSLEENISRTDSYQKTSRWDLAFGGLYNSFISGNNGSDSKNNGYGTTGKGGILVLAQAFDNVTDIPADSLFKTGKDIAGTDDSGSFGQGTGWYLYDFNGNILGDGSYDKQHVAYALPATRTVVVRTAKGNYAKLKMISCYKNAFTATQWFRNTPHMYFTFEYVLVPQGSKKFEIKP
ncbi:MAG: HmuY family protein [Chitinophagaceae bacterium]